MEELHEIPRDLALGAADERHLDQLLEDAIRDRARLAQCVELAHVLHGAELLDDAVRRHWRRLEADAASERLGELGDHVALRLDRLRVLDGTRGLEVAKVGEEPDAVALDEERAVRAVEADEVDDVDRVRDEERLLEQALQAGKTVVHAFSFRYSR